MNKTQLDINRPLKTKNGQLVTDVKKVFAFSKETMSFSEGALIGAMGGRSYGWDLNGSCCKYEDSDFDLVYVDES